MEAFTEDLDGVRTTVTKIEAEYNITTDKKTTIEEQLEAIEAKLAQAEALLTEFEQPVFFREASDALTIESPEVKSGVEYNEVKLHFKYSSAAEGLLFFTENSGEILYSYREYWWDTIFFTENTGEIIYFSQRLLVRYYILWEYWWDTVFFTENTGEILYSSQRVLVRYYIL